MSPESYQKAIKCIEEGSQADRVHLLGLLVFIMLNRLKNPGHKDDLMRAYTEFVLHAGCETFISIVSSMAKEQGYVGNPAALGKLFTLVAARSLEISRQSTEKLSNLMDVLESEQE